MTQPKLESIGDIHARLWHKGILIDYAYFFASDLDLTIPPPQKGRHRATPAMLEKFRELVEEAKGRRLTGRPLSRALGDLGEYFAAIMFGIKLHADPMAQGSDGFIGNDLVEIKTITPVKKRDRVTLNPAGDFDMIAVVKITADYQFGARLIHRRSLRIKQCRSIKLAWDDMLADAGERTLELNRRFPIVKAKPKPKPAECGDCIEIDDQGNRRIFRSPSIADCP